MTVSLATFLVRHPEFSPADTSLVQAALDAAEDLYEAGVAGDRLDHLVEYRAAAMLARSPFARDMRLVAADGTTIYDAELERVELACGRVYRVLP